MVPIRKSLPRARVSPDSQSGVHFVVKAVKAQVIEVAVEQVDVERQLALHEPGFDHFQFVILALRSQLGAQAGSARRR